MKRALSIGIIFIAATLTAVFSLQQKNFQTQAPDNALKPKKLGFSWQISNSQTWQLNPEAPNNQTYLSAAQVNYQNDQRLAHFKQPFIIRATSDKIITAQSQFGKSEQENIMTLSKQVKIVQFLPQASDSRAQNKKTLLSEKISYNNQNNQIHSDLAVTTLLSSKMTLTGVGMTGDLDSGHYQILSNVKTHYVPNEPSPISE